MKKQSVPYRSDETIIRLYRTTHKATYFNQLYNRHLQQVIRQCAGFTNNRETAEDLAQEIFVKVHERLHKFEGKALFSTWLYQVTRNVCLDHLRKDRHRRQHENHEIPKEYLLEMFEEDPEDMTDSPLLHFLASLPLLEKNILMMKYGFEWPIEEIAIFMDMSEGAIKMRLKRAKEKLKQTKLLTIPS